MPILFLGMAVGYTAAVLTFLVTPLMGGDLTSMLIGGVIGGWMSFLVAMDYR